VGLSGGNRIGRASRVAHRRRGLSFWVSGFGPAPDHLNDSDCPSGGSPDGLGATPGHDSYLVDSASSHMLVSKIKPCMSKYKQSIR